MNIGTKLNVESDKFITMPNAYTAVQCASRLMHYCAGKSLQPEDSLSPSERLSILTECAELIVRLSQISLKVFHKPLPSTFCVYPGLKTLSDASIAVMENISQVCLFLGPESDEEAAHSKLLERHFRNSASAVCLIVAKLGEIDLEPFIAEHLRIHPLK